jgi:hypothetical protein
MYSKGSGPIDANSKLVPSYTFPMAAPEISVAREKILEHRLLSDLAVLMLKRNVQLDVLRSEFDAQGHDVVLEAGGVIRHVQFKASVEGGARAAVNVNILLRQKPSGCVVWMSYNPESLAINCYRWLGGRPGEPLPFLGEKLARQTKANAQGKKAHKLGHRLVAKGSFDHVATLDQLADRLFGPACSQATSLILAQLRQKFGIGWPGVVCAAIGAPTFFGTVKLANLVNGYRVLEQLHIANEASWKAGQIEQARVGALGDVGIIWTLLFLQHRAARFHDLAADEPLAPLLDALARQLIELLDAEVGDPQPPGGTLEAR